MDLVVLIGSGAVGKMTVGQELMKITDYRLFHNHMMIEPVIKIFGKFDGKVIEKLRGDIFDAFMETPYPGMIYTYMWAFDMQSDWDYIKTVTDKFEKTGGTVYYVELIADRAVRLERNKTENRLNNKESKRDLAVSEDRMLREETKYRVVSNEGEIPFKNYLRIDNTNLEPDVVARMIKEHFNLPDKKNIEMFSKVKIEEAREDELEQLHAMQIESFMPLYEKYHQRIRLSRTELSPTQVSGGIRPSFQFGHPTQDRGLTIRERCRLQSFPDNFYGDGGIVQGRVQTGNAVPPLLAKAIALAIKKYL